MHFPRLPDWLVYLSIVLAMLFVALGRQERANAPPKSGLKRRYQARL